MSANRCKWSRLVVICLVLLVPLYSLSIGPTTMLVDAGYVQPRSAEAIYSPMSAASSFLRLRPVIDRYIALWR